MAQLQWDKIGERLYETGVDRGVLYLPNSSGVYNNGYAWNGLTAVTESPSGAESNPQYADNIKYLNLVSAEEFGCTIEAFTYPDEFLQCDGTATPEAGVSVGQQSRRNFGFSYRTLLGNDLQGTDYGYKIHMVWNALAAPSEKAFATVNDSPEALTFSWEVSTTPVAIPGVTIGGLPLKPTASITIDSTKVSAAKLLELENKLYGTSGLDPVLPTPAEVVAIFSGSTTEVTATAPTYNDVTNVITIPAVTGVAYQIDGETVASGAQPAITVDTWVHAVALPGYRLSASSDDDWVFEV